MKSFRFISILTMTTILSIPSLASAKSYLEITLQINQSDRPAAAAVYTKYKQPFLMKVAGANSKELLVREDDVQVLHGFDTTAQAKAYLKTSLFNKDVVKELGPLLQAEPEVRIYEAH